MCSTFRRRRYRSPTERLIHRLLVIADDDVDYESFLSSSPSKLLPWQTYLLRKEGSLSRIETHPRRNRRPLGTQPRSAKEPFGGDNDAFRRAIAEAISLAKESSHVMVSEIFPNECDEYDPGIVADICASLGEEQPSSADSARKKNFASRAGLSGDSGKSEESLSLCVCVDSVLRQRRPWRRQRKRALVGSSKRFGTWSLREQNTAVGAESGWARIIQ